MHKTLAGLGLALAMWTGAACGGAPKSTAAVAEPPAPPPSPCAPMATHVAGLLGGSMADADAAAMAAKLVPVADRVVAERCQADAWPPAAIDCFAAATMQTLDDCEQTLTPAQRQAIETHMEREMAPLMPAGSGDDAEGGGGAPAPAGAPPPPPDDPCGGGA